MHRSGDTLTPMDDEGIPEERPWRKREYSGASSTLGIAALVVLAVGAAIWFLEFRGDPGGGLASDGYGIIALEDALNPTGKPASAEVGRAAPDFRLRLLDGSDANLSDYRGKTVVLNFWASWCGPCRSEAPDLEAVHLANPDQVVVLGVNQQETQDAAAKFRDEFGLTYPMPLDRTGEVSQAYRLPGLPVTVLIGPDGVIERMFGEGVTEEQLTEALEAMAQ